MASLNILSFQGSVAPLFAVVSGDVASVGPEARRQNDKDGQKLQAAKNHIDGADPFCKRLKGLKRSRGPDDRAEARAGPATGPRDISAIPSPAAGHARALRPVPRPSASETPAGPMLAEICNLALMTALFVVFPVPDGAARR